MIIEKILTNCMRHLSRCHLTFQRSNYQSPPKPPGNKVYLLYIHIPFCEELCPYCSFNRIPFQPSLASRYFKSLKREIEMYQKLGFHFESIYVGGGTPTVVPSELAAVLQLVQKNWPIKKVSVETNPNHLNREIIKILKEAGVNRLSVGVQTFDDGLLASIERLSKYGSGSEIKDKLSSIIGIFDTLNIDMIFNLPNQTLALLQSDIDIIKMIKVDQVTFYPLMISRTTRGRFQSRYGKISYVQEKQFFKRIVEELSDVYLPASAWCFTRTKGMIDEYIVDYEEYAGLGSGSFGYIDGTIYSNTFSVQKYIDQVHKGVLPILASKRFSKAERIRYDLLMRLFGRSLNLKEMAKKYGDLFWLYIWKEILFFLAIRAITLRDNHLLLTPRGQYYLVVLMREFFTGVNNFREIITSKDSSTIF